jgi:hypothetical protein
VPPLDLASLLYLFRLSSLFSIELERDLDLDLSYENKFCIDLISRFLPPFLANFDRLLLGFALELTPAAFELSVGLFLCLPISLENKSSVDNFLACFLSLLIILLSSTLVALLFISSSSSSFSSSSSSSLDSSVM